MDFSSLIRDSDRVLSNFKIIDNRYICKKACTVVFPGYYTDKALANVSSGTCVGIVAIVVDDAYAVMNVCAMVEFSPDEVTDTNIETDNYYLFQFDAGSTVITNMSVVKDDSIPYKVYNCFVSGGKFPVYLNYNDACTLFDTADSYAGSSAGENPEIVDMMISLIARDINNQVVYYRQIADKPDAKERLSFISIRSVDYGATNTVAKLGGARFQTGIVSAIVNPTERVENIEKMLRL